MERLNRYLSRAGVASRRQADELIAAGRVKVNGSPVTLPGTKVDEATACVELD
ncbi:MAG TPA: S4 domain-containing protein, partial [Anaerolineae bacterium]|nr:S4 domain-containing protein [Anaerolineae bacterium]